MTIEELTVIARDFLREAYGITLDIPIERNNRLRRSQGRYISTFEDKPLRIEIAGQTLEYGADEAIIGTLKHECIHYAMDVIGQPGNDGHPHFEAELRKHGAPSTDTARLGLYYVFQCEKCGDTGVTARKGIAKSPYKYSSGCCHAKITYLGERIYDGTEAVS